MKRILGKRQRSDGFPSICGQRELGELLPTTFKHRARAPENTILCLGIERKLVKHRGSVNSVSFNEDGSFLVSGSDDRMIALWEWDAGLPHKSYFESGHSGNVLRALFMPHSNNRTIVTCAEDNEVRYASLRDDGSAITEMLAKHNGTVRSMAVHPETPQIFYSCGHDGVVRQFDLRTKSSAQLLGCTSYVTSHPAHLNDIAIDPRDPDLLAVAGGDEYVRLYDKRMYYWDGSKRYCRPTKCFCPPHLVGCWSVDITSVAFSDSSELLASYTNNSIYRFTAEHGLVSSPSPASLASSVNSKLAPKPQAYTGHDTNEMTVKGVNFFGPNCEFVVGGSDFGRLFVWRKRDGELLRIMQGDKDVVNWVQPHPYETMLASCGSGNEIKIWTPFAKKPALQGPSSLSLGYCSEEYEVIYDDYEGNFYISFKEHNGFDDDDDDNYEDDGSECYCW